MSRPGTNVSASNKTSARRRKGVALAVAALPLSWFVRSPWDRVPDPVYQGKHVSEWFELYCAGTYFLGNEADFGAHFESSKQGYAESVAAFREIQGNAIPFLVSQIEARQTMGDRVLAQIKHGLPSVP